MDKSGKKVNRIAGDEILASAAGGKDIWNSITPQISQTVATKTVTAFTAFVPADANLNVASSGSAAPVKAAATPADVATATTRSTPTQTGSIDKQPGVVALVPSVTGAPVNSRPS